MATKRQIVVTPDHALLPKNWVQVGRNVQATVYKQLAGAKPWYVSVDPHGRADSKPKQNGRSNRVLVLHVGADRVDDLRVVTVDDDYNVIDHPYTVLDDGTYEYQLSVQFYIDPSGDMRTNYKRNNLRLLEVQHSNGQATLEVTEVALVPRKGGEYISDLDREYMAYVTVQRTRSLAIYSELVGGEPVLRMPVMQDWPGQPEWHGQQWPVLVSYVTAWLGKEGIALLPALTAEAVEAPAEIATPKPTKDRKTARVVFFNKASGYGVAKVEDGSFVQISYVRFALQVDSSGVPVTFARGDLIVFDEIDDPEWRDSTKSGLEYGLCDVHLFGTDACEVCAPRRSRNT